jgi:hypothetical protein
LETVPPSAAEAVDRIFSFAEAAVASIGRQTEHRVRELAASVEARGAREAARRRDLLVRLRHELTDRASALALHYEEVLDQLEEAEAALTALGSESYAGGRMPSRLPEPLVPLRLDSAEQPVAMTAAGPLGQLRSRRRWWRLWHREAA